MSEKISMTVEMFIQLFNGRVEELLLNELHFLTLVCDPNPLMPLRVSIISTSFVLIGVPVSFELLLTMELHNDLKHPCIPKILPALALVSNFSPPRVPVLLFFDLPQIFDLVDERALPLIPLHHQPIES